MKTRIRQLSLAVMICILLTAILSWSGQVDAFAAEKSHTYVLDAKSNVGYPTAIRVLTNSRYEGFEVYLPDLNYSVSVKGGSGLITKVIRNFDYTNENSYTTTGYFDETKFKKESYVRVFAPKDGTYNLTLIVKNENKKEVLKKKIKVFAGDSQPIEKITFNGKEFDYNESLLTPKASGKVAVKAGKDFKVTKLEYGGFNADGTITWKTFKNKGKVTLSTVSQYKEVSYTDSSSGSSYSYTYESGYNYDYIFPMTEIRITVMDKKLKTTYTVSRYLFKK